MVTAALMAKLREFKEWVEQTDSNNTLKQAIIGGYMRPNEESQKFLKEINSQLIHNPDIGEITEHPTMGYFIPTQYFLHDISALIAQNPKPDLIKWTEIWSTIIDRLLNHSQKKAKKNFSDKFEFDDINEDIFQEWFKKVEEISIFLKQFKNIKPWHFYNQINLINENKKNIFIEAAFADKEFIKNLYNNGVPGYEIVSMRVICNLTLIKGFYNYIEKSQGFHNNSNLISSDQPIPPNRVNNVLKIKNNESVAKQDWREKTRKKWIELKRANAEYTDAEFPNSTILTLWNGFKNKAAITSIAKDGYIHVADKTDPGYFAAGYYFTPHVQYAAEYAKRADPNDKELSMLINRVIVNSVFPVIEGDINNLYGTGTPPGFNAVFAPVVHIQGMDYKPPSIGKDHKFIEIAAFDSTQCLPQYEVIFHPIKNASSASNSANIQTQSNNPLPPLNAHALNFKPNSSN
jgi:hypothetical protein